MFYVGYSKENEERAMVTLVHHKPNELPEEMINNGLIVDSIPDNTPVHGKASVLYINPTTGELWYEYVERELTSEEKIKQLESELSVSKSDNVSNMLAITELYEMILGGGA